MWVIKVYFGNGTWYRGVCERDWYYKATARRRLLSDFKATYSPTEIKERGNARFRIFFSRSKK